MAQLIRSLKDLFKSDDYSRIKRVGDLAGALPRLRYPYRKDRDRIEGWLRRREEQTLYALGRMVPPRILEVGPSCGKSTIAIARGIRDSGVAKRFVTCELNPGLENFRPTTPGKIGFFYPPESEEPMGESELEGFEANLKPILSRPGGILGQLRSNLKERGLEGMVSIHEGDFREMGPDHFDFIFSDTMHNEAEISRNIKDLISFLAPGGILACHDIDDANEAVLKRLVNYEESVRINELHVGVVTGLKN